MKALSVYCEACGCWPAEKGSEMCSSCAEKYRIKRNGAVKTLEPKR